MRAKQAAAYRVLLAEVYELAGRSRKQSHLEAAAHPSGPARGGAAAPPAADGPVVGVRHDRCGSSRAVPDRAGGFGADLRRGGDLADAADRRRRAVARRVEWRRTWLRRPPARRYGVRPEPSLHTV